MSLCSGIITCSGLLEFVLVVGGAIIGGVHVLFSKERVLLRVLLKAILLTAMALVAYPVSVLLMLILLSLLVALTPVLESFVGMITAGCLASFVWIGLGAGLRRLALTNGSESYRFFSGLALGAGIGWFLVMVFGVMIHLLG